MAQIEQEQAEVLAVRGLETATEEEDHEGVDAAQLGEDINGVNPADQ